MSDFISITSVLIGTAFFFAGIVKGVTGMGLPTVAMGVLGAILSPTAAASLLIVPSFVTNVWQLLSGPSFSKLFFRFWMMLVGVIAGTIAGSAALAAGHNKWTNAGLGLALIIYAAHSLFARPVSVSARLEKWLSPAVGVATGLITGATGVLVMPAVPFLQSLGLSKDDLVQALGLSFTVSTIALATGLARGGVFGSASMIASTLAVGPALLGMWLGQIIRNKISAERFRKWFLFLLIALGLELISQTIISVA